MNRFVFLAVFSCFSAGCVATPDNFESAPMLSADQFEESRNCSAYWETMVGDWISAGAPTDGILEMRAFALKDKDSEFSALVRKVWANSPSQFSETTRMGIPSTDDLVEVSTALDKVSDSNVSECGLAWLEPAFGNVLLNPNRERVKRWLPIDVVEKNGMTGAAASRYVVFWLLVAEKTKEK
jgi:hypothetical protein